MLNIGRLAPGAADYYLGEVATSAEDYYSGRGESPGRWMGSLAAELGLTGTVDPETFRAVLEGRHPVTGEVLIRNRVGRCHARRLPDPNQASLFEDDVLDVPQVAARLGFPTRHVRRLLAAGKAAQAEGRQVKPGTTLLGERVRHQGKSGPLAWAIPRAEVERFEAEHRFRGRPGYDLTLRPPKSVSVLWALTDDTRRAAIRDAHRSAVNAVVDYYERHACYARRPTGERGRVDTDGLIAAAFDHRTSRAGDPLLHTHVVCANLTRTAEGRWQAIDGRPIFEHAHAAGYLYQAHLRHELTRTLGVRFGKVRNGYAEVEGVPREVVKAFSKRRDEIEELVAEAGYTSARAHQAATLASRKAKDYGVDALTLEEQWRAEAAELGFGGAEIEACFGHDRQSEPPDVETLFDHLGGSEGLTREASTFTRQDVVEAIAEAAGASLSAAEIDALATTFVASGHVQAIAAAAGDPGSGLWRRSGTRERAPDLARYTTPELLALEQQVLAWAEHGFGGPGPTANPAAVAAALERHPELSAEQAAMVRAVCAGESGVQPVAGRPGSGKTHATAACVEAFLDSGVPVVGCALSAVAAAELEAATGLQERTGRPATTIARLLLDAEAAGLAPGTVLVVDEASMVGTRDLARLGSLVARAGGAMKLIGDPDQHGPVDTGGVFRRLVERGADVAHLMENNRQQDARERQAVEEFRQELVELALSRYDADGKVVRSPSAAVSVRRMVDDWYAHVEAGGTDPMIAGTNRARHTLNALARYRLADAGALTGPVLTAGEREFQAGDWVVARRNAATLRSPDRRHFVKNGSAGRVVAVDPGNGSVTVDFTVEGRIRLPGEYVAGGHLEHGYARTSYGVQGATLERAFYHPGDTSSFEEGYVALTRGRQETRIYLVEGREAADDDTGQRSDVQGVGLETVAEALERRRSKTLALDADPLAEASRRAFGGWSLAELRAERDRVEAALAKAPPSPADAIEAAERQRDRLLAQRRAWEQASAHGHHGPRLLRRRRATTTPQEAISAIDNAVAHLDRNIERLHARAEAHQRFLAEHAGEAERLRLVYRAELDRELHVRAEAVASPDADVVARLGPPPGDARRYQLWRDAIEQVAVHADRYGAAEHDADPAARYSYERVRDAFRAAMDEREPELPEPEVLVEA